jgi:hypothetical protein
MMSFERDRRQDDGRRRKAREKGGEKEGEDRLITGTIVFLTDIFVLYLPLTLLLRYPASSVRPLSTRQHINNYSISQTTTDQMGGLLLLL